MTTRNTRGLTLVELLVSAAIFAIIAAALGRTFYSVLRFQIDAPKAREAQDSQMRFEDRLRSILQSAYLSPTANDQSSYLIGTEGGQNPNGAPNLIAAEAAPGTPAATAATPPATTLGSPSTSGNSDGIVLTVAGRQLAPNYLLATGVPLTDQNSINQGPTGGLQNPQQTQSTPSGQTVESDMSTLNQEYGPQGGIAEISITQTAVGNPGTYSNMLYMRVQKPADADYTQGGTEQVFDANIQRLQFEFFDGTQWDGGWDTTQTGYRHLPAAIKVHYWLKTDPNTEHIFVVRLPLSDLTPAYPLSVAAQASTAAPTTPGGGTFTGVPGGRPGGNVRPGGGGGGPTGGRGGGISPIGLGQFAPIFSNLQIEPDAAGSVSNPQSVLPSVASLLPSANSVLANRGARLQTDISAPTDPLAQTTRSEPNVLEIGWPVLPSFAPTRDVDALYHFEASPNPLEFVALCRPAKSPEIQAAHPTPMIDLSDSGLWAQEADRVELPAPSAADLAPSLSEWSFFERQISVSGLLAALQPSTSDVPSVPGADFSAISALRLPASPIVTRHPSPYTEFHEK